MEIDKVYRIDHSRKGIFILKITSQDDTWTTGVIVEGKTTTLNPANSCGEGEKVTLRTAFIRSAKEIGLKDHG